MISDRLLSSQGARQWLYDIGHWCTYCLGAVFVAIAVRAAACVHVAVVVDDGVVVLALLRPLQIIVLLDALAERVVVRRALGEEEAEVAQSEHLEF